MRVALPSLDDLEVATPCSADWDHMPGDDRVRFCPQCRQNVYNLSVMTAAEATDLLRQKERLPCVRFYRRRDGTVMTADCPVGIRQLVRHPGRWMLAFAASALAVMAALASCGPGRAFVRRVADSFLPAVAPGSSGGSCPTVTMGTPPPPPGWKANQQPVPAEDPGRDEQEEHPPNP